MGSKATDAERERVTREKKEKAISELVTRYSLEELRKYRHLMEELAGSRFGSFDAADMPLEIPFPKQKLELIDEAIKRYQTFEFSARATEIEASGIEPYMGFLHGTSHHSLIDHRNLTAGQLYSAICYVLEKGGYKPGDEIIIEGTVRLNPQPDD